MKPHVTAKPSHYNQESEHYDKFSEEKSTIINQTIENILKKHKFKTVLDMTCGTGSQVFWLTKRGYQVIGSDINTKMLKIARAKAKQANLDITFLKGDMRDIHIGQFDAVLTIFNSIGHLTKYDFEKALRNIHNNLHFGGLYIFDIFNLDYLLLDNNITKLTIDWQTIDKDKKVRNIQYSTIDKEGILASYDLHFEQKDSDKTRTIKSSQTLQIYSAEQLRNLLKKSSFNVLEHLSIDGSKFDKNKSDRILTIAQKIT